MPNTGHHGHGAGRHRAGERLVVKGHKVLERPAAAHQQDAIGRGRDRRGAAEPLDKLLGRALALHLGPHADKLHQRVASAQRALDVVDNGAGQRRDHGDARAKRGDTAAAGLVHKTLAAQLLGQRRHLLAQHALARKRERTGDKAHLALGLIKVERAREMNLHAVAQIERALKVGPFPDDAVHGGRIVLYLEIAVAAAGVGAAKARDLAQNAQLRNAVQRPGGDVDRLRDGDGVFLLSRRARGSGKVPTIHGQPSFHVVAHQCAPAPPRAPISRAHRGACRGASLYGSQSTASPGHMLKKTSNKASRYGCCRRFRCERCARGTAVYGAQGDVRLGTQL